MRDFNSIDEILDFAIREEEQAHDFYTKLASRSDNPGTRKLFEGFAAEEEGHRAKLVDIKSGKQVFEAREKVVDLKIGDYLVDVKPAANIGYKDALVVAMKKEKAAFRMYTDLAGRVEGALRETFLALAEEEARHKLRFEIEYDDNVLREA
jgi:rubrerythrin